METGPVGQVPSTRPYGLPRHSRRGGLPRRGADLAGRAPHRRVRRARRRRRPGRRDGLGRPHRVGARARRRPLGRPVVARGVRRPRRRRRRSRSSSTRSTRRPNAPARICFFGEGLFAPTLIAVRHRGAEAALPPEDPVGRGAVVPGLLRAERRLRPRRTSRRAPCSTATSG